MHFQELKISQFKNHAERKLKFSPAINVVVGKNGSGKTNLLDAIHFLGLTKSAFMSQDALCVQHENDYFMIKGILQNDNKKQELVCSFKINEKKAFLIDKKPLEKLSDFIGTVPVVLMTPFDTDLIRDGAESRRKFLDNAISQSEPQYLSILLKHNRILLQRNSVLKQFAEQNYFDKALVDTYSQALLPLMQRIFEMRQSFLTYFIPKMEKFYAFLSDGNEVVKIEYQSDLFQNDFNTVFDKALPLDTAAQRTTTGIHKDDLILSINDFGLKKYGSQGQQKSFVMAMKLALYESILDKKGKKPLLLMDDIFDKLDENRIAKLLELIDSESFGQVFITDARPERSKLLMTNLQKECIFIEL